MSNLTDEPVIDFFSVLLKEPIQKKSNYKEPLVNNQSLEHLLSQMSVLEKTTKIEINLKETQERAADVITEIEETKRPSVEANQQTLIDQLDNEFQVLFFDVAGLVLAIPLVCLGGIIKLEKLNKLIGKPEWFKGVQHNREQQVNVVDTAAWVMPEKYTNEVKASTNYQYIVLLEGSHWGLACESLLNADKVEKNQINWRKNIGKRPWLAGVVTKKMCGILNVQALIELLDNGMNCHDSID